nr:hypothetical protein BaRGS_009491 [Batillaria attramentaria]
MENEDTVPIVGAGNMPGELEGQNDTNQVGNENTVVPALESGPADDDAKMEFEAKKAVRVEMRATFMKITDIDTLSQQFEAEVFIQAKWEELFFLGMDPKELKSLLAGDLWDPELIIGNLVGDFDQERRSYMMLILILSFTSVSIEPQSADRLVSTITLFLTLVAFKLVIKQSLPTISYLTYLGSLIYLVLYSVENAVVAELSQTMNKDLVMIYDELAIVSLAVLLILCHLIFIIYIQITALKRRRQMSELDKQS